MLLIRSPLRELAAFGRVHELPVGESANLDIALDFLSFSLVDENGIRFAADGEWVLALDSDVQIIVRVE